MPIGCDDDVMPWSRKAENVLDTKYPYVCHAEMNAILNKNSASLKDCSMYVCMKKKKKKKKKKKFRRKRRKKIQGTRQKKGTTQKWMSWIIFVISSCDSHILDVFTV